MLSDLRQAARNYLLAHDDPDPAELVDDFLASLDPAEAMELMRFAAHQLLLEANRSARTSTRRRSNGKSWRDRSRPADLLGARHQLGISGPWKVYGDCTPDEVDLIAGALFERADDLRQAGEFYRDEAAEARQRGAATMADLYALREAAEGVAV